MKAVGLKRSLIFMLVISLLLFSGCGGREETWISDDDILADYHKAVEAYSWFHMNTMDTDYEESVFLDDYDYSKVDHDTIHTYSDLENYLKTIFSDDLVNRLLTENEVELYRDIDGALYTIPAGRGSDIFKGDETYDISREGDTKFIVKVTVEVYDDPDSEEVVDYEVFEFPYELVNGKWVFTDFDLVR